MFYARRPSVQAIERFLRDCQGLALSYEPAGIVREPPGGWYVDDYVAVIGHGRAHFDRALAALLAWKPFDIGWVEVFPQRAEVAVGTVVALLIRHLGFWSLNGCRVLYTTGSRDEARFGFAYGTLTNHAESGEELFEVFVDLETDAVIYRIRACSRPRALLARLGLPIARRLQARFRGHSAGAMARAIV